MSVWTDNFTGYNNIALMQRFDTGGNGVEVARAEAFQTVVVVGNNQSQDSARIYDTPYEDVGVITDNYTLIRRGNRGSEHTVVGFQTTLLVASGGAYDSVHIYDSSRSDEFVFTPTSCAAAG